MNKIFRILFVLVFFISGCSYEPIFISKKYDFKFEEIISEGDININKIIKKNLLERSSEISEINYILNIISKREKEVISSNTKGDPLVYKLKVNLKYYLYLNDKLIIENEIVKQTNYNNSNDKFELSKYEDNILKNLSESISSELLVSITTLKK
tara:strand:- start:746 stop:1207 length:462 start_codon:yes stop_codon:yes gene_type:complete